MRETSVFPAQLSAGAHSLPSPVSREAHWPP